LTLSKSNSKAKVISQSSRSEEEYRSSATAGMDRGSKRT